ncbi:24384_t:CDS:2, partial [Gigaspora rosea]
MCLFIPIDSDKRNTKTQAVFEKDRFYSVGGKFITGYYRSNKRPKNKVTKSNKCSLKVSLVGVPQESPIVLESNEDAIFNVLVIDYLLGQEWNFIVKVV